jgi:hypothetical protein
MALKIKIIEVNAAELCSLEAGIKFNGQQISSIREFKVAY